MIKRLNKYLFNLRAQKYLKENPREHRFVNYSKAKTVLLLFESDFSEENKYVHRIIQQMKQDGKKVSAWGYIDKKKVETAIFPDFRILHHKQTDFFHKPLESFIHELQLTKFDLLIDLSVKPIILLDYLALYATATFKTGIQKTDIPLYDFVLNIENIPIASQTSESVKNQVGESYLYDQIIFYLKRIQTTD